MGSSAEPKKIISARLMSTDFEENQVRIFSKEPLIPGIQVSLLIDETPKFYVQGRILWCSRVSGNYPFRSQLVFELGSDEEAKRVREFSQDFYKKYSLNPETSGKIIKNAHSIRKAG